MIRLSISTGAAALAVLLASAGAAAQAVPGFSVRDSAGIRIAESTRPAWEEGQGWTVADTPMVSIGMGRRGAGTFRLPDGRIAVATMGRLLYYRPDGTRPDSVMLEHPEEWIGWMGMGEADSLMAFTRTNGIYAFSPDGRIGRRSQAGARTAVWPDALGRFADGTLLAYAGDRVSEDPNPRRDRVHYVLLDPRGAQLGVFGRFPDMERMGMHIVPFSSRVVVVTRGEDVLVGDNRTFEYMVVGRGGGVRAMVRRPFTPMAVTPEDVETWRTQTDLVIQNPSPATQRFLEEDRAERRRVPAATVFPAYSELMTDEGGNVWAFEAHRPADPQRHWSVFDPEGRWLGTVRLPDELWPQQVGADWVLGTRKDAEGNTHVQMFALRRTTGGPAAAP